MLTCKTCILLSPASHYWRLEYPCHYVCLCLGTCADADGKETTIADVVETLLPTGGYKGHGLAAMVECMSCSATG